MRRCALRERTTHSSSRRSPPLIPIRFAGAAIQIASIVAQQDDDSFDQEQPDPACQSELTGATTNSARVGLDFPWATSANNPAMAVPALDTRCTKCECAPRGMRGIIVWLDSVRDTAQRLEGSASPSNEPERP
jgi:hypothetical protein